MSKANRERVEGLRSIGLALRDLFVATQCREGWEDGPSEDEAAGAALDRLSALGLDPGVDPQPTRHSSPPPDPLGLAAENLVLRKALREARAAVASAPASSFGNGKCVRTAPNGECAEMVWPLRDELVDNFSSVLFAPTPPAAEAVREVVKASDDFVAEVPRDHISFFESDMRRALETLVDAVDRLRRNFPSLAEGFKGPPVNP